MVTGSAEKVFSSSKNKKTLVKSRVFGQNTVEIRGSNPVCT